MYSLLIAIIYLAFVSLGLPDSLLGLAWSVMRTELDVPVSYAGIIFGIIAAGTIISSLFSNRLIKKLGTGLVTAISVLTTTIALFGLSALKALSIFCLHSLLIAVWSKRLGFGRVAFL